MTRHFTTSDGYCIESATTFSITHSDLLRAMALAEYYFQSAEDSFQMTINEDTVRWLVETMPEYWNLIKFEGTVVGSTLIMPTSRPVMTGFLDGTLTEAGLFEALRQSRTPSTECVYCAGAALLEPYNRGQTTITCPYLPDSANVRQKRHVLHSSSSCCPILSSDFIGRPGRPRQVRRPSIAAISF